MERLRSVLRLVVGRTREAHGPGPGGDAGRTYECRYCGCTAGTDTGVCPECRVGRLVPSGPEFESKPGFVCRNCGETVDHRHERCPDCGSPRFEGVR